MENLNIQVEKFGGFKIASISCKRPLHKDKLSLQDTGCMANTEAGNSGGPAVRNLLQFSRRMAEDS